MTTVTALTPDVVIVGGGPSGLTAAAALAPQVGQVLVLDREREAGGIPRHSDHMGYGVRDLRRVLSGPAYARRLVNAARAAGAVIRTEATVTRIAGTRALEVTTPSGLLRVEPKALVLATGARERPRPARLVAGTRPAGVYTTGQLQNLVHLHHRSPGTRAVVVGAELVSWSAVWTLRQAGCRTALMTSQHACPETYRAVTAFGRAGLRVPVATRTRVVEIEGHHRVEGVVIEDLDSGGIRRIGCDTVVFTGDWIPDNELARASTIDIARGSLSPVVDAGLRTSAPGVFAIGNLVHPVDTADVAALDGRRVVDSVLPWLAGGAFPSTGVILHVEGPMRWIAPSRLSLGDGAPARGRLLSWVDTTVPRPVVETHQGGRLLGRHRVAWPAVPGRVFRLPSTIVDGVDPHGTNVTLRLV